MCLLSNLSFTLHNIPLPSLLPETFSALYFSSSSSNSSSSSSNRCSLDELLLKHSGSVTAGTSDT